MKNKQRKGFTIVELVIVIAIIAILAAVLIPTFSNVIYKAKVSKDTQLIRNLNTALAADNKEHNTMYDAVVAAEAFGYSLEKIDASATDNKILWDSVNDVFCYYNKDSKNTNKVEYIPDTQLTNKEVADVDYWMIANELPLEPKYSIYAGANWTESGSRTVATNLQEGFDVGSHKEITNITYTGTDNVVIRTNNDNAVVTVNNPDAEVDIYGTAGTVKVEEAAPSSVHIYGEVLGNVEVTSGHVVIESKATVSAVVAMANTAKITVQPGATCTVAQATGVEATIEGVAEDEIATVDPATMNKFAGGLGTKESPYLIANSTQFINIESGTSKNKKYYKIISDIQFSDDQAESGKVNSWAKAYHPSTLSYVVIEGQGNKLIAAQNPARIFDNVTYSQLSNLEVYVNVAFTLQLRNNTFTNVDTYGKAAYGNNSAVYTTYAYGMSFVDCDCYVNIEGTRYNAVFMGYTFDGKYTLENCNYYGNFVGGQSSFVSGNAAQVKLSTTIFSVNNCNNYGEIISLDPSTTSNFIAIGADKAYKLIIDGVENKVTASNYSEFTLNDGKGFVSTKLAGFSATTNGSNITIVNPESSGIDKFVIKLAVYGSSVGGTLLQSANITVEDLADLTLENAFLSFVDVTEATEANGYTVSEDAYGNSIATKDGVSFYIYDGGEHHISGVKAPEIKGVYAYINDSLRYYAQIEEAK